MGSEARVCPKAPEGSPLCHCMWFCDQINHGMRTTLECGGCAAMPKCENCDEPMGSEPQDCSNPDLAQPHGDCMWRCTGNSLHGRMVTVPCPMCEPVFAHGPEWAEPSSYEPDPALLEELRVSKARVDRLGRQSTYLVVVALVGSISVSAHSWLTTGLSSATTTTALLSLLFVTNASWMAKVFPLWLDVRHLRRVAKYTTTKLALLRDDDA